MSNYNAELLNFEMDVDETLENISGHYNLPFAHGEKNLEQIHSLLEQKNMLYTNNLQMNNCHGEDVKNVRNIEASTHGTGMDSTELELSKYFNLINSPSSCPSAQYMENGRNQSLDEFFHDFYEIISSEMATSSKGPVAASDPSHIPIFDDQSKNFDSNGSDGGFNLDLTQFYVDAPHESDLMMLQSPAIDFPSHLQPQYVACNENKHSDIHSEPAIILHSNGQEGTEFSQIETLKNGQLKQFYLDFKLNGDVASGSIQQGVQSLEYINDNGKTETVMYIDQASNDLNEEGLQCVDYTNDSGETEVYVDQASNDQDQDTNAVDITQYKIIDYEAYQNENADSTLQTYQISSLPVENIDSNAQVTFHDESQDTSYQPDLLTSLLSNKNNKIIIITKPLRNPKIRPDEFHSKFEEICVSLPNIPILKRPTIKRCRKQKLELINQIDSPLPKSPERRRQSNKIIQTMLSNANFIHETPKLPSKYIRDRKKHIQVGRKRPRKLFWDSDSDC